MKTCKLVYEITISQPQPNPKDKNAALAAILSEAVFESLVEQTEEQMQSYINGKATLISKTITESESV